MKYNEAYIYDMRTNDLWNPIGIGCETPVFSWKVKSDELGWLQKAYQIVVRDKDSVVWDSGKVAGGDSVGIAGDGSFAPCTPYTWTVTVWDQNDRTVTGEAAFETALPTEKPFGSAQWISHVDPQQFKGAHYTVDLDFVMECAEQGFCFHMKREISGVMMMLKACEPDPVMLTACMRYGKWNVWPGTKGKPVSDILGYSSAEVMGKKIHERCVVDGKTVSVYLGRDENSLTFVDSFTHSEPLELLNFDSRRKIGKFDESAPYEKLVIRDAEGNVVFENSFTKEVGEYLYSSGSKKNMPVFRKTVGVKPGLVSARLYTSGLGVYESYINGERVGRIGEDGKTVYDDLKPGFTEASTRRQYNTYDVTAMLKPDQENILSAVVSGGWWSDAASACYGQEDAYLAKLVLHYADGSSEVTDTDTSWKSARASAVRYADIFTGEIYDARVEENWRYPGFDDSAWSNVKINTEFDGTVCPWKGSPIVTRDSLERKAESITVYRGCTGANENQHGEIHVLRTMGDEPFTLEPGETAVIDFGQNFAGREAIRVEGARGTRLVITHGEMLNDCDGLISRGNDGPEGSVYNDNYRSAIATTRYTMKGCGPEAYHPSFTFYGFRYIEIMADQPITVHSVTGQVVTSVEKETGWMETSDAAINQLISNCRWGQYSNYLSVPTDCPQRDERQGWMADTQVFTKAGCYMAFSKSFLAKFMQDIRDSQREDGAYPGTAPTGSYHGGGWGGTGWADAGVIIPYQLYKLYGDKKVILEHWDSMQLYVDCYLGSTEKHGPCKIWGDWLAYESNDSEIQEILGVAFYAWDAMMMQEMAQAIGKTEEAKKYRKLYEEEKAFFCSLYVQEDGTLKRGEQSVCAYALFLDLLPDAKSYEAVKEQFTANIIRNGNKLQTGFLGTAILLDTLTKVGRSDLAYSVLLQHENPSWLYSVDQGATTIWNAGTPIPSRTASAMSA